MSKSEEQVLVVPRPLFDSLGAFQGMHFDVDHYLPALLSKANTSFLRRGIAETDPGHKQLIPYALLVHKGRVLHYVRGKKAGEQRLAAKGSVGIGGHINDGDEGLFAMERDAYDAAVEREVNEELILIGKYTNRIVALLNDDSNEVGRVHLGVVHRFDLENDTVERREQMITQLEFLTPDELRARHDNLESWSQICVENLDQILVA